MKKTLSSMMVMGIGIGLVFTNPASAEVNLPNSNEKFEIVKTHDGRIKGVESLENLKVEQIDHILNEMGFSQDEISKMNGQLKKDIAKAGGKKASLEFLKKEHEYTNLKGNKYIIGDHNKESIKNIETEDINEILNRNFKKSNAIQYMDPPSMVTDQGQTFNLMAIYQGEQGSNYVYQVFSSQFWNEMPRIRGNDTLGIAWGDKAKALDNTDSARQSWFAGDEFEQTLKADRSSIYGTQWKIPEINNSTARGVYTSQKISIPIQYKDSKINISSGFVHGWGQPNYSFKFGPSATIDLSNANGHHKWSLNYNINVGS
ncbi:hypothetical protein [Bacillus sp. FSL R9-9410]|uniref:hypothetical protein n=1 Tax=Bacillus sp. FSL R9-9410 TaxID=2921590 RepID=UPI003100ADD8